MTTHKETPLGVESPAPCVALPPVPETLIPHRAAEQFRNYGLACAEHARAEITPRVVEIIKERDAALARIAELESQLEAKGADAERYRWLRDPNTNPSLVLDKVTGYVEWHEGTRTGGYSTYEYRSGEELDAAIDARKADATTKRNLEEEDAVANSIRASMGQPPLDFGLIRAANAASSAHPAETQE